MFLVRGIRLFLVFTTLISFASQLTLGETSYAEAFKEIAAAYGRNNSVPVSYRTEPKLHLIRVPKAGSSSLSIVARRIVGCEPRGPCCKWPGEPPGSCPSKDLYKCETDGKVIGCTHHYPNYPSLLDSTIPSISIMREPISRAISAFFYPGIHHNSFCTGLLLGNKGGKRTLTAAILDRCFPAYLKNNKWKNPTVKMLTGAFAYANERTCLRSSECKRSLELALVSLKNILFMGISELWELSVLVLHAKMPKLRPILEDFKLAEGGGSNSASQTIITGKSSGAPPPGTVIRSRENKQTSYAPLKIKANSTVFADHLVEQNRFDLILYEHATYMLCIDLHRLGLWNHASVRQYWSEKAPFKTTKCP